MAENQTWLARLLHTEPARLKGIVVGIVGLALVWGLDLSSLGDQANQTIDIVLGGMLPLLAGFWIRPSVYSPAGAEKLVAEAAATGVPRVTDPPSSSGTAAGVQVEPRREGDLGAVQIGWVVGALAVVLLFILLFTGVISFSAGGGAG